MSWFDAAGLANIAKSALKEAQRTIDKALDIKDDGVNENNVPVDTNNDDYFGTWVEAQPSINKEMKENVDNINSIWGSFTGSFFDHSKEYNKSVSLEGLEDSSDINSQHFSQSKLVVDIISDFDNTMVSKNEEIWERGLESSLVGKELINESFIDHQEVNEENIVASDSSGKVLDEVLEVEDNRRLPNNEEEPFVQDDNTSNRDNTLENEASSISTGERLSSDSNVEYQAFKLEIDTNQEKTNNDEIISLVSSTENAPFPDAITVPPSRQNTQFLLSNINDTVLISTQPQSSQQEIPEILRSTNIIDIPMDDDSLQSSSENALELSTDEGSQSDVTIKGSENNEDSGSETEKDASFLQSMISDSDRNSTSGNACDSSSVINDSVSSENLSIIQLEMPPRDYSPLSSDKSDLVKIGSDHTSGHTSGDDLETATSSDIEIISSPNGGSSGNQSRHSPIKKSDRKTGKDACNVDTLMCKMTMKNAKGHNRELSEASSISDDSNSQDVDKLIRKIAEITEILESRETKIVEINRKNLELQELNMELKTHLNSALSKQLESQDLTQVTEEYAQRMSVLEKKFQQAIREKDTLRKELEQAKQESSMRLSKGDFDTILNDKDEMIKQLREEGEKLSKQQLQHSNIIKKLRTKEKENETTIKQLKERLEDFTSETDRLKRTVNAKEEVERTQIEAVNQLTSKNKKLENELVKLQSELDDQVQKYDTLKKSLDAARKELNDKSRITTQLSAKEQMLETLENEKKVAESQSQDVINQLQYLRMKLHESECEYLEKEQRFRKENNELVLRLENAECRNEELSQTVLEVSKPLVRQLESLQATHNLKLAHFEKIELELTSKISDLQFRVTSAANNEKESKDECVKLAEKLSNLEEEFNRIKHDKELLEIQLDQLKTEKIIIEQELRSKTDELQSFNKTNNDKIELLHKDIAMLKSSLKKSVEDVVDHKDPSQLPNLKSDMDYNNDDTNSNPRSNSPTLSVGKASVADSIVSSVWSQLESFDVGHVPRYSNMFEIQMLQTNLQQREGELQQLQWELNRREQERNLMNTELTSLTSKVEELTKDLAEYESLKVKLEELQEQYDLLCQMYGEKVDEVEELKLDLLEAKEAYKSQLDELLKINTS